MERASLSDGVSALVMTNYAGYSMCFTIVTVRLGYSWLKKVDETIHKRVKLELLVVLRLTSSNLFGVIN